mgnify:CR=1 FL=1
MDKAECEEAAKAVGAALPLDSKASRSVPCGCSAMFDKVKEGAGKPVWFHPHSTCGPTGHTNDVHHGGRGIWECNQICNIPETKKEEMNARDEHGQLENKKTKPFC